MKKQIFCRSYVTGNKRKTKHVNFHLYQTGCFLFGFKIKRLKKEMRIHIVFLTGYVSIIYLPVEKYKAVIAQLKKDSLNKFGLN